MGFFVENILVIIGKYFFSDYFLFFELVFVLLLMVMVGVIILVCWDLIFELFEENKIVMVLILLECFWELIFVFK